MSEKLLKVSNISISFIQYSTGLKQKKLKVISDLSLEIGSGEIIAVLGSSGSGKSLLAHSILGILPSNANLNGKMTYNGKDLNQDLKEKLRGHEIALIPQSVKFLDPLMKVSKQVIGEYNNEDDKKEKMRYQRQIFEKYGLSKEVDDMYPFQLSGGMARRVLISTALLSKPKLVIADEPTPGLDDNAINETLKYIKQMAEDNVGVLLITHDIDVALNIADKIAIFYAGYLIEIANVNDFSGNGENLLHPYTKALYHALPQKDFKLSEGHQPLHEEVIQRCPFFKRCKNSTEKCGEIIPNLTDILDKKVRCHRANEFKESIVNEKIGV